MTTQSFIVVETKKGRTTPSCVWEASSEQDYCARVAESNPRSGDDFEDFDSVVAGDEARHAMRIEIIQKSDFDALDQESCDVRILQAARCLSWIE